jgi:hypothetical protein
MRRSLAFATLFFLLCGGAVIVGGGCSDKTEVVAQTVACAPPPSDKAVCFTTPGEFPPSNCDPSTNKCGGGSCAIDEGKCGSKSTCLPMASNAGKDVLDFRIRRLNIAAPDALAAFQAQKLIITANVELPAKECGEGGVGGFNWLLRFDKKNGTLTTGGAPPSTDPFGLGYCFVARNVGGVEIGPVKTSFAAGSTGALSSATMERLYVPIFRAGDVNRAVILPLSGVSIRNVNISSDGACIGALNASALAADCSDDAKTCSKWKTAGTIAGYITLEEADTIDLPEFQESLCVLLTKSTKGADGKCVRDGGKIKATGDYCSKTRAACGCADSFWLAATFAASAVKIYDGATNPACMDPAIGQDGGTDAAGSD